MAKYISKNVRSAITDDGDYFDDYPMINVPFVDDMILQPTGLLDADGTPLWRLPPPIGFGRDDEW